jgi:cytosine/adenosine deaminase-related metal-dependent hydrolase
MVFIGVTQNFKQSPMYDLLIRNGYVAEHDKVIDIGIVGGMIETIASEINDTAEKTIDAKENLVGPGFVECHLHIDKSYSACGRRRPKGNADSFSFERIAELESEYFKRASVDDIKRNAIKNIEMAVSAGSTFIRSHVGVGNGRGLKNMEAVIQAREETAEIADVQLVVSGGDIRKDEEERIFRDAIEMGLDNSTLDDPVLVGGADPATRYNDIEGSLDKWYQIASEYDIGMDLHIQDGGTLGIYTLDRMVEYNRRYDYQNRVTASHCFCMSHIHDEWVDEMIDKFKEVGMKIVTCYQSTRSNMPIKKLLMEDVNLGHGTDNDRDFVFPHGNADVLEGALIESNKLHGDRTFVEDYRWFDSNKGLSALWEMITRNGARILDIEDDYGIQEGTSADLIVFDKPSPQWAIITQAQRSHVIKNGKIVVENNKLKDDYVVVPGYDDVLESPIQE